MRSWRPDFVGAVKHFPFFFLNGSPFDGAAKQCNWTRVDYLFLFRRLPVLVSTVTQERRDVAFFFLVLVCSPFILMWVGIAAGIK